MLAAVHLYRHTGPELDDYHNLRRDHLVDFFGTIFLEIYVFHQYANTKYSFCTASTVLLAFSGVKNPRLLPSPLSMAETLQWHLSW